MAISPKLTTTAACRVARLDRDRFNEHVAAGRFTCAPKTVPGRARLFDPDDMLALVLFRELLDDGFDAESAGKIACCVAGSARENPQARAISYVQSFFPGHGFGYPADQVPAAKDWDKTDFCGTGIRKVTTFSIGQMRELIERLTEEERSIIGEND